MTAITNQYKGIPKVQEENYELTMDQTPENIKGLAMKHRGCYKREEAKHYLFEFDFLLPKGTWQKAMTRQLHVEFKAHVWQSVLSWGALLPGRFQQFIKATLRDMEVGMNGGGGGEKVSGWLI